VTRCNSYRSEYIHLLPRNFYIRFPGVDQFDLLPGCVCCVLYWPVLTRDRVAGTSEVFPEMDSSRPCIAAFGQPKGGGSFGYHRKGTKRITALWSSPCPSMEHCPVLSYFVMVCVEYEKILVQVCCESEPIALFRARSFYSPYHVSSLSWSIEANIPEVIEINKIKLHVHLIYDLRAIIRVNVDAHSSLVGILHLPASADAVDQISQFRFGVAQSCEQETKLLLDWDADKFSDKLVVLRTSLRSLVQQ